MNPTKKDFQLAKIFLNHSLQLKSKEKLLITSSDNYATPLVKAVYIEALKLGAYPLVEMQTDFSYQFFQLANNWQLNYIPKEILEARVNWPDAYVRIVAEKNIKELNQIPKEKLLLRSKLLRPYSDKMIDKDRWILTDYPTPAMAQEAGVSLDWLMDFYYRACLVDYEKMKKQLIKIEKILDKGKRVRIIGEKTDLSFSIEGRLAQAAYGERNIPDGEVFLAPLHLTTEGYIYFDMPSSIYSSDVSGIYLEFKKGKVVKARANIGNESLQKIIETDNGARYLGELGIGANYEIKNAMKNTLFDEKIGGTIHLALGRSYKEKHGGAPQGGNESAIHWDIVKDMRKKGSVLYVDGKPLLKEGKLINNL